MHMIESGAMVALLADAFPLAGTALAPLRAGSEPSGADDFTPLWSGQAARLGRELPAGELTVRLAKRALEKLGALQPAPDQPRKSPNRSPFDRLTLMKNCRSEPPSRRESRKSPAANIARSTPK